MSRRTLFLIFALFLITFTLLLMALFKPQTSKTTTTKTAIKDSVAQTVLYFGGSFIATPSSIPVFNYLVPINISTGKNKVTAVQLELQYDPEILTNMVITSGPFFTKPDVLLNKIDAKNGRISYAFSSGIAEEGVAGKGVVANLTFSSKEKVELKTVVSFLPKTLVTAQGITGSVLRQQINAGSYSSTNNSTSSAK